MPGIATKWNALVHGWMGEMGIRGINCREDILVRETEGNRNGNGASLNAIKAMMCAVASRMDGRE